MNELIKQMVRIAEETSKRLNNEYVTIELDVNHFGDNNITTIKFRGYTESGGYTDSYNTVEEVESAILLNNKAKLSKLAGELRMNATINIKTPAGQSLVGFPQDFIVYYDNLWEVIEEVCISVRPNPTLHPGDVITITILP